MSEAKFYIPSLKQGFVIVFLILLAAYTVFQARFLILGPVISIHSPQDGELLEQNVIMVTGKAQNIAFISFNDRPIFIDSEGNWSEKYIAPKGLSEIKLKARDRFGRESEKRLKLVYN